MWAAGDLRTPPEWRARYGDDYEPGHPRKRFRHARRYYRRLRRRAEAFELSRPGGWYDMWHTHPDWRGDGNRGGRHRRRHLEAGFIMSERALRQAAATGRPMQVFMSIMVRDAAQDAVWVHTPNPNRDNFPFTFPDVQWDVPPPPILRDLLAGRPWQLGRLPGSPGVYWIREREKGT